MGNTAVSFIFPPSAGRLLYGFVGSFKDIGLARIQFPTHTLDNPIASVCNVISFKGFDFHIAMFSSLIVKPDSSIFDCLNNPFWVFGLILVPCPLERFNYYWLLSVFHNPLLLLFGWPGSGVALFPSILLVLDIGFPFILLKLGLSYPLEGTM